MSGILSTCISDAWFKNWIYCLVFTTSSSYTGPRRGSPCIVDHTVFLVLVWWCASTVTWGLSCNQCIVLWQFIHVSRNTSLLTIISSAQIHCDSDHSQNWTLWSVSSLCNCYTICMDDICDALFITHVALEVQFQVQSFWLIALDLLSSWQVKPSCCHHQLKFLGDMLLVCLKDSQYPGVLKNLTNRTLSRSWYVRMMTVIFQLSVTG